jgi:hypothetical protein
LWFKKTKQKQVAKEFCLLCPFVVQKNETKVSSKRTLSSLSLCGSKKTKQKQVAKG